MNIAYLVIAWNKPELVKRMVDRLDQPNARFYVHIDRKSADVAAYKAIFADHEHVTVLSEYKVYWGGISQVKTALYLFGMASNAEMKFKYYVLLSGQDYPIKPNSYINDFFNSYSCDFVSYNRIADLPESFANKYKYFHYMDLKYINPKDPHKIKWLYYLYYGFYKRLGKYLPHRKFYKDFEPYFGSDWLALTNDTVQFILDFVAKNKDYMRYMSFTEIPSETFIHSILLNTERKHNLCDYDKFEQWLKTKKDGEKFMPSFSSLRFMDWSETGQATKPATLDLSYFEEIKNDPNLYCRKVDDKLSTTLLDKIDIELLRAKK